MELELIRIVFEENRVLDCINKVKYWLRKINVESHRQRGKDYGPFEFEQFEYYELYDNDCYGHNEKSISIINGSLLSDLETNIFYESFMNFFNCPLNLRDYSCIDDLT